VLSLLALRGVINQDIKMNHLMMSEKKFEERYITTYQEVIPEVLEAYGARIANVVKQKVDPASL
jgi:mTERF domain-containing protein, mitochondrial